MWDREAGWFYTWEFYLWSSSCSLLWMEAGKTSIGRRDIEEWMIDNRSMEDKKILFLSISLPLTEPVIMSYIRAPRLHQSTARLWPERVRISGALRETQTEIIHWRSKERKYARSETQKTQGRQAEKSVTGETGDMDTGWCQTHMYSMVPQKVWVTAPSWMDSLHSPKSVNLICPEWEKTGTAKYEPNYNISHLNTFHIKTHTLTQTHPDGHTQMDTPRWTHPDTFIQTFVVEHDVLRF